MVLPTPSRVLRWTFAVAAIMLVADVAVCLLSVHQFFEDVQFAENSDAFLDAVNTTLSLIKDAETGQRGYILTGDERFLEPYRAALRSLDEQLPKLRRQTTGAFREYRDQITRYEGLVRQELSSLLTAIEVRRAGGRPGLDLLNQAKEIMDQARAQAAGLIGVERAALAARNERALGNLHWTYASFGVAAALDLLLLGVLWWTAWLERSLRAEAERANRIKDEFLATLSHELRTPIHAVLGWTSLLTNERVNDLQEIRRGLRVIEQNAEAQARLVEELLDLSRIIAGRLRLECVPVDLAGVVHAAIEAVQISAQQKRLRLSADLPPVGPVWGDPARLQQVVWNLLTNAVKFTPEGGQVEVALRGCGVHVELTVQDDGMGIDADLLPNLFERFRQGDSSLTRRYGGLGIGLALVKSLVDMQGGSIEACSEGEGRGATFTVRLPLAGAATAAALRFTPCPEAADADLVGHQAAVQPIERDSRGL